MAITSVGPANPGRITGVGVANPGRITGVGVARPGRVTGVGVAQPGRITGVNVAGRGSNKPKPSRPSTPPQPDYSKQIADLMRQIEASSQQVYAPELDYARINAQSRKAAARAVNPLYTRKLNTFLKQQTAKRTRQKQLFKTASEQLQEDLQRELESTQQDRARTSEDVATQQAQSLEQEDQFQTDTGTEFEDARLAQAREQAVAGTLDTGAGARQTGRATQERNVQEEREVQRFEQNRQAQELFKTRTFEDLLESDELSKLTTKRGKKAAKFELNAYLQDLKFETQNKREVLEAERLEQMARESGNQRSLLVNNFINSIKNSAQRDAAFKAYGALL